MIFYFSGTGNSAWVARQLAEGQNEELLSIAVEIDKNKEYKLYDESNRVVETKRGDVLYKSHYDKVEQNLRKHYEQQKDKSVSITTNSITNSTTTTKRR